MKGIVLIPAYKPDEQLVTLVEGLADTGLALLIVDDGSGAEFAPVFERVADRATVLTHEINRGKGMALKTGIAHIREHCQDAAYFITADADGQHRIPDILRVRDELELGAEMVLSTRIFRGNIPFRSRFGNGLSRFVYTTLTGHFFLDNQSGLRGFAAAHTEWLLKVGGERYDYEMNVLYYTDKQRIPITTVPIEAVYIDGNKSSHFNPVHDTLRIYRQLFKSARASFFALALAEVLVLIASLVFGWKYYVTTLATVGMASCTSCILYNVAGVFRRINYMDTVRTVIYTILRYIAYTVFCQLIHLTVPIIPLFGAYNIAAIVLVPLEYLMHKLVFYARYRDIHKS